MTAVDHLSRYAETAALSSATAEDLANSFISNTLLRHGAPAVFLSDRGRQFLSQILEAILKAFNAVLKTTSSYHSQTNGLTERFNGTLADMISMYITSNHTNMDTVLPFMTFALNTAVQTTAGFSPFRLVYGREPTCFIDTIYQYTDGEGHKKCLMNFTSRAEECHQLARLRTSTQQDVSKLRYDERHRDIVYDTEDLVWLWAPVIKLARAETFLRKCFGPYRVSERTSPVHYVVEPVTALSDHRCRSTEVVHVSRLNDTSPPRPRLGRCDCFQLSACALRLTINTDVNPQVAPSTKRDGGGR